MRITFKMRDRETGLARIGAGPRGFSVKVDGKEVGSVGWHWAEAFTAGQHRRFHYYFALSDGARQGSLDDGVSFGDMESAKVACKAHLVRALAIEVAK